MSVIAVPLTNRSEFKHSRRLYAQLFRCDEVRWHKNWAARVALDQFGWDDDSLRFETRRFDSVENDSGELFSQLLGKFTDCCQWRMSPASDGVVATTNTDVFRNSTSAVAKRFVSSVCCGVVAGQNRRDVFVTRQERFRSEVAAFNIIFRVRAV